MLSHEERVRRIKSMLAQVAGGDGLESLAASPFEAYDTLGTEEATAPIKSTLEKVERQADLSPDEVFGLEAIILPDLRPVVFINNNVYDAVPMKIWAHLNRDDVRRRLQPLLPSIGRVEVPLQPSVPYGGTAFVVGENLLMTNRHVAKIFAEGRGTQIFYHDGGAAIDFKRERKTLGAAKAIQVNRVKMIHPYWDMALLEVEQLPATATPLKLSVKSPEELIDRDVVVVGYPARDYRNDLDVQDRIFAKIYGVKRLQPGKLRPREQVQSFETIVDAMTHDSSTLGGNSGSVLIDVAAGEVVGLHFAGEYLKANYAVPTFELARDARVVDAGLNFQGKLPPPTGDFDGAWRNAGEEKATRPVIERDEDKPISSPKAPPSPKPPAPLVTSAKPGIASGGVTTLTVPLSVTISLGGAGTAAVIAPPTVTEDLVEKVPVIYPDLKSRAGYEKNFLGFMVPLPKLTDAGKAITARLDGGSRILKYHHFSIVMHKERRLALFTAANVDWRDASRKVQGKKPSRDKLNGFTGNEKEDWVIDPRIPLDCQLPDYFYVKDRGSFDRGHLVRRDDAAWGKSFADMQKGNGDTFHMTNCSPQIAAFNQSKFGNFNWGELENMVQQQTQTEKVCVFAGPVLDPSDRFFHGLVKSGTTISIQIPQRFWKIIVAKNGDKPAAFGFILDQDLATIDLHAEMAIPNAWKNFLRPISEIEDCLQGLAKLTWFNKWDQHGA
jgi:endonuclease G, mitochondrial